MYHVPVFPDPVGYADQLNLYAYVFNSPFDANDPTGKCATIKDSSVRSDCLRKREEQKKAASDYIEKANVAQGAKEDAYIATYNVRTGQVTVRVSSQAGRRSGDDVRYTNNQGEPLELEENGDGRMVEERNGQCCYRTDEVVLVLSHSHPKWHGGSAWDNRRMDNANENLTGENPGDPAIVDTGTPLIIKTPSEAVKLFQKGVCPKPYGCVLRPPPRH